MPARDLYHHIVKEALLKGGWIITHDPYPMSWGDQLMDIDLGAEQIIGAENEGRKIAVEVKSFLNPSRITDFYGAIGQYELYEAALDDIEKERILYLAMPAIPYADLFEVKRIGKLYLERRPFNLIVFDPHTKEIIQWLPKP